MRVVSLGVPALGLTLVLSACGGGGDGSLAEKIVEQQTGQDVDVDRGDGSVTITGEDGSITFDDSGGITVESDEGTATLSQSEEVPPDFPLPVPDGVQVTGASRIEVGDQVSWTVIFDFDPSRVDEIADLYLKAVEAAGLQVEASSPDPGSRTIVASDDRVFVIVSLDDYGEYWEASVSWTPM